MSLDMDPNTLHTPAHAVADFCLIPIGTPTTSLSHQIASIQLLLQHSGLKHSMHSAGTTVEGSWDEVTQIMGKAHALIHAGGVARIQTDIRIGTRTDKQQGFEDKVASVRDILAKVREREGEGEKR